MKTLILNIEGMSCENCVKHVREALEDLKGVSSVEVNLSQNQARVETGDVFDESGLGVAIDDAGYELTGIDKA